MRTRQVPLAILLLAASLAVAPSASAQTAAPGAPVPGSPEATRPLRVDAQVERFAVRDGRVVAYGTARVRLKDATGRPRSRQRAVAFRVQQPGGSCRVLNLSLGTLRLDLLGLQVTTSAVNLRITGDPGATLGRLFCQLTQGLQLSSAATARAARSLNRSLRSRPMRVLGFTAHVRPVQGGAPPGGPVATGPVATTSQAAGCPVLDVVLGPLNLDLVGLIVELFGPTPGSPVQVVVTADPTRGVLGEVFCRLAGGQQVLAPPPPPAPARTVTTVGTGVASIRPRDRDRDASIRAAVERAQDAATGRAAAAARDRAHRVAAASGLILGPVIAVAARSTTPGSHEASDLQGTFGPGRFCGEVRRSSSKGKGSPRRVCRVPSRVQTVATVTFAAS